MKAREIYAGHDGQMEPEPHQKSKEEHGKGPRKRNRTPKFLLVVILLVSIFGVLHLLSQRKTLVAHKGDPLIEERPLEQTAQSNEAASSTQPARPSGDMPAAEEVKRLRLKAMGDVMHHQSSLARIKDDEEAAKAEFALIRHYLRDADITMANFESAYDPNKKPTGYPRFNAPKTVFPALKDAGFTVLSTVNNHALDMELDAVSNPLRELRAQGITTVGTREKGEKRYSIIEVKGMRIGLVAYTSTFNGIEANYKRQTLNERVNFKDMSLIKKDLEDLKAEGVDFIIGNCHSGIEYASNEMESLPKEYKQFCEWGMDVVIGNHPHVVEPFETYVTADGRETFIIYACGNFISSQRYENTKNYSTEHGVIVDMQIEQKGKDHARILSVDFQPTWVKRTKNDKGFHYQTLLAEEYLRDPEKRKTLTAQELDRVQKTLDQVYEVLYRKKLPETHIQVMENPLKKESNRPAKTE